MMRAVLVPLVLVLLALGGCVERKPVVGVLLPLTSEGLSQWGYEAYDGFSLALTDSGLDIEPLVRGTAGTVSGTIGAFETLVRQGATVVIGPIATDAAKAVAVVAKRHEVPFVSPSATGEGFTEDNDFAFRFCYQDREAARDLAAFARRRLGLERVAVVVDLGTSYSVGLASAFSTAFAQEFGLVVEEIGYWAEDPECVHVLDRVAELDVDGAFIAGYGSDVARMARASVNEDLKDLVLLGGDGWDNDDLRAVLPSLVRDAYHTSHFHRDDPRVSDVRPFATKYEDVYQVAPSDFAALTYDTTRAVLSVFDPSVDGPQMARRLASIRSWPGTTGVVTMGAEGDPMEKGIVLEQIVEGGPSRFVERTNR